MIVGFFGYAAAQFVAMGMLLHSMLDVPLEAGMAISAASVITYTCTGGMWAVSLTDFVQAILIIAGLAVITVLATRMAGGVSAVFETVPSHHWSLFPERSTTNWLNLAAAWLVIGGGSIASQDVFQRVNSARSAKAARWSAIGGGLLYLALAALPLYLAIAARVIAPGSMLEDMQLTLPQLVRAAMPTWVQILFFGALLSAIMSTCSGALLATAGLLSENVVKQWVPPARWASHSLFSVRICAVAVGAASLLLAWPSRDVFELVGEASAFRLVSILVPFTAALFLKHVSKWGAYVSMAAGTTVWIWAMNGGSGQLHPLLPGLGAALVAYTAIHAAQKLRKKGLKSFEI
jgi:Na+/proline symporter